MPIYLMTRPGLLTAAAVLIGVAAPCRAQVNPLSVTYPQTQAAPAGMVVMNEPPPEGYSLAPNIHGFLTTGVSTGGGNTVQGGVLVPVVPGLMEVAVSGGTGSAPAWVAEGKGVKSKPVKYDDYAASVHIHPSADVDMTLSVTGLNAHGPLYGVP